MNISKIIRLYKQKRITQQEFADGILMSKTNLNQVLLGNTDPKISTVEKMAAFLNVPVGYFFDEEPGAGNHINGNGNLGNGNSNSHIQINGEMACKKELEKAKEKIMELQDKIIKLQENTSTGSVIGRKK